MSLHNIVCERVPSGIYKFRRVMLPIIRIEAPPSDVRQDIYLPVLTRVRPGNVSTAGGRLRFWAGGLAGWLAGWGLGALNSLQVVHTDFAIHLTQFRRRIRRIVDGGHGGGCVCVLRPPFDRASCGWGAAGGVVTCFAPRVFNIIMLRRSKRHASARPRTGRTVAVGNDGGARAQGARAKRPLTIFVRDKHARYL